LASKLLYYDYVGMMVRTEDRKLYRITDRSMRVLINFKPKEDLTGKKQI